MRCLHCDQTRTAERHDPCIANLPGVMHACCGHGQRGCIRFLDGRIIRVNMTSVERFDLYDGGDDIPEIEVLTRFPSAETVS